MNSRLQGRSIPTFTVATSVKWRIRKISCLVRSAGASSVTPRVSSDCFRLYAASSCAVFCVLDLCASVFGVCVLWEPMSTVVRSVPYLVIGTGPRWCEWPDVLNPVTLSDNSVDLQKDRCAYFLLLFPALRLPAVLLRIQRPQTQLQTTTTIVNGSQVVVTCCRNDSPPPSSGKQQKPRSHTHLEFDKTVITKSQTTLVVCMCFAFHPKRWLSLKYLYRFQTFPLLSAATNVDSSRSRWKQLAIPPTNHNYESDPRTGGKNENVTQKDRSENTHLYTSYCSN